ncbi:MAG: hypothetical protein ACXVCY_02540 [Pseudobdellovibrionaceae bacterium]
MKLEIAKPEDTKALAEFYKSFPVRGLVELKIDRNDDFFVPYSIQSDKYLTYKLTGEENKIEGAASFIIRDVLLQDKVQPVVFGRDLRISSNRRAILEWTQHFLPVMEEVFQMFKCKHMFTSLSLSEVQALNAFVRPRAMKRPLPHYYLFRRFNLVSVHGRFPWAKNPLPQLRIRRGSAENVDALINYIVQKSRQKDLSTVWDAQSFYEKLERWKNLKLDDFLIAFDKNDNVIGCAAPWSSGGLQEFIPLEYSLRAHNFRQFLKFGKMLGWTRTLTKPVTRLKIEASFNFKFLNFLSANNADIFESLLWKAFDEAQENEFLVYSQQRSEFIYRRPLNWISGKMPFGVYLLQPPDSELPEFLHPSNEKPIEMEPFFSL